MKRIKNCILSSVVLLVLICLSSLESKSISPVLHVSPSNTIISDSVTYHIVSRGEAAYKYQAFPDACRLANGDILIVFYAGEGHVTFANENYPLCGRICMVRSSDDGKTWSEPVVVYDDLYENRDPHVSQLKDGTIVITFFSLKPYPVNGRTVLHRTQMIRSTDNGKTWIDDPASFSVENEDWYCSAPVRELEDGTLVFPVYHQDGDRELGWGGVFLSYDNGKNWSSVVPIGKEANLYLAAETDVIRLNDGAWMAVLRGQKEIPMHYSISKDQGKTWSPAKSIGFAGHSPHLNRMSTGEILLTYRGAIRKKGIDWNVVSSIYTAMRISFDEGATWQGPYLMSKSSGAYPSTVELKDKSVLMIFYQEGKGSGIGVYRFEKPGNVYGSPDPYHISRYEKVLNTE
jgi:Neuraminidase (sialidase)